MVRKKSGYTLVELLVVIGIMIMMLSVSIASYRTYERRDQVKSVAKSLRSLLWEGQGRALAPSNKNTEVYKVVKIIPGGTIAELIETVSGVDSTVYSLTFTKNISISEVKGYQGITSSMLTGESIVTFKVNPNNASQQMEIVNNSSSYDKLEITFSSTIIEDKYIIIVDKNLGNINIKKA